MSNLPEVAGPLHVLARQVQSLPQNLVSLAPTQDAFNCWLGDRIEIVGWGETLRLNFSGSHAMRDASRVWKAVVKDALVDIEAADGEQVEAPRWPIALASFGFADSTPGVLIVPEFAAVRISGSKPSCWLVSTALDTKPADPELPVEKSREPVSKPYGMWTDPGRMTQSKWKEAVGRLILMLRSGAASKVVLTRDIPVSAASPIDPRFLAEELKKSYPTTWVYAVEGLVGATPEMLASLDQNLFTSRVLAGTAAPGRGDLLLNSMKNRTEHHLAVESVARAVAPLSETLSVPTEPGLLDLPNVTHLSTKVTGVVKDADVLEIAEALHPTAAVCGTPTKLAFDILEGIEGTQRGRYTGPVGWVDASGDGEFAIALRCGQLSQDRTQIRIFAGGGIMPDSNPDMELAETRAKMRPLLEVLGVE